MIKRHIRTSGNGNWKSTWKVDTRQTFRRGLSTRRRGTTWGLAVCDWLGPAAAFRSRFRRSQRPRRTSSGASHPGRTPHRWWRICQHLKHTWRISHRSASHHWLCLFSSSSKHTWSVLKKPVMRMMRLPTWRTTINIHQGIDPKMECEGLSIMNMNPLLQCFISRWQCGSSSRLWKSGHTQNNLDVDISKYWSTKWTQPSNKADSSLNGLQNV